ncbi:hypothetical protein B0J11DRAFT_147112 [Dendryphion nanum]|uniref:BYS1 domain protein n=1 Tax=Dendryphion nanum TaxID=256645 RepID=A0A9P9D662_9PLEO|nr:hypothetical protein B0J11DRAFT_147112 [Dendryphion nanum]
MHLLTTLPLFLLSILPLALALSRAIVTNQCSEPLYLWSVGGSINPQVIIPADTSYSEVFHRDPASGGIALKITAVEGGLFKPNVSQTIFSYNLDGETVWYDLSDVFGDGFYGRTLSVKPSDSTCQSIVWPWGKPPAGSQVRSCGKETDLELSFCTGRCLPSWSPCGNAAPNDTRTCCTHCIGSHHCVAPPSGS